MSSQVNPSMTPDNVNLDVDTLIEPMGLERLKEALAANDWDGGLSEDVTLDDLDEDDEEAEGSIGFGIDATEMEEERCKE